jgi:hypothetical protein
MRPVGYPCGLHPVGLGSHNNTLWEHTVTAEDPRLALWPGRTDFFWVVRDLSCRTSRGSSSTFGRPPPPLSYSSPPLNHLPSPLGLLRLRSNAHSIVSPPPAPHAAHWPSAAKAAPPPPRRITARSRPSPPKLL